MRIPYVLTPDSITVRFPGDPVTVTADHHSFEKAWDMLSVLRGEPITDEKLAGELKTMLSLREAVQRWSNNDFVVTKRGEVSYRGEKLPRELDQLIAGLFQRGNVKWQYFANFWIRLNRNPSRQSVLQLFKFLANKGIPIGPDGYFYCYKGVNQDYKDNFSRTFDNRPGNSHRLPRNKVSDDPKDNCAVGFHAGNKSYATRFGNRLVICRVDPADVARVQNDGYGEKIGISAYSVVADGTGKQLPSGTWTPGNDQYAKNYRPPEEVNGAYNVWLTKVPEKDTERILKALGGFGIPLPVGKALLQNLPVCVLAEVDGEDAKSAYQQLTPKQYVGRKGYAVAEVRGAPLVLDAPEPESVSPAMFEVEEEDSHTTVEPDGSSTTVETKKTTTVTVTPAEESSSLLDAKTGVDKGSYEVTPPERPNLEELNRTKLRVIAKDLGIPRYSKPGAKMLRELIRNKWLELAKEREAELEAQKDTAPEPDLSEEMEVYIVESGQYFDQVIAFLEDRLGIDEDESVDPYLDGSEAIYIGPEKTALEIANELVTKFECTMRTVPEHEGLLMPAGDDEDIEDEPTEPSEVPQLLDYDSMNRGQLRAEAKARGMTGYGKVGAPVLRSMLRQHDEAHKPKTLAEEAAKDIVEKTDDEMLAGIDPGSGEDTSVTTVTEVATGKTMDVASMDRKALRGVAKNYGIPFVSKLGAVQLRKLISGVASGELVIEDLRKQATSAEALRNALE